jgi:antitoxin component of MazEF toxin-antitoxin module
MSLCSPRRLALGQAISSESRACYTPAMGNLGLGQRRRLTLPRHICEALEVRPGDRLSLEVVDGGLVIRPSRVVALEALRAIQQAFAESGITEEELLESAHQIRDELFREKYGHLAKKQGI